MIVFESLQDIANIQETAVALGNFDGVHVGHQALIRDAVRVAEENGLKSAVFTFSNHPRNLIAGEDVVKNILLPEEKRRILESLGIDYLFEIPFTKDIATTEPADYVRHLLAGTFRARDLFCGFNYHFGHRAGGDVDILKQLGEELGLTIHVHAPVRVRDMVVSSTLIRDCIAAGEMEDADALLGRAYELKGTVVVGNQLGREIGFPTCNISVDRTMATPPNGVYITHCLRAGETFPAITNIGVKPTIGTFEKNVETHIFDFDQEMYGEEVRIAFLKMVRPEMKFENLSELKAEIARNCDTARAYHNC